MTRRHLLIFASAVLLSACAPHKPADNVGAPSGPAGAAPDAREIVDKEIQSAIAQLAAADPAPQQAAATTLRRIAWPAVAQLVAGQDGAATAVRDRIGVILQDIVWSTEGLSPDDARLMRFYRERPADILQQYPYGVPLEENDPGACAVARAQVVLRLREPAAAGDDFRELRPRSWLRHVAELKRQGQWDKLEWELIGRGLIPDLLDVLRERSDAQRLLDAVKSLRKSRFLASSPADLILAVLSLGTGDMKRTVTFAKTLGQRDYAILALARDQDWDALSQFPVEADFFNVSRFIPAGALLFAGKMAQADAIIRGHSKSATGMEPVVLQRQLVLLGRVELINQACMQRGDSDAAAEFLLLERRYAPAFALRSRPNQVREGKDAWPGGTIKAGGVVALGPAAAMDDQIASRLVPALVKLNELDKARAEIQRLEKAGGSNLWLKKAQEMLDHPGAPESDEITIPLPPQEEPLSDVRLLAGEIKSLRDAAARRRLVESFASRAQRDPVFQFLAAALAPDSAAARTARADADMLLGGDVTRRLALGQALEALGLLQLAEAQARIIIQIAEPATEPRFTAHELLARIAQRDGRFDEALREYHLGFFANFYSYISIPEDFARFYAIARDTAYCQARVAITHADPATAQAAAAQVIDLDPEDLEPTLQIIAALRHKSQTDQARDISALNRTRLEAILKDFPNSHLHHYLIAKLDLDTGFTTPQTREHLETALRLSPNNAAYLAVQRQYPSRHP